MCLSSSYYGSRALRAATVTTAASGGTCSTAFFPTPGKALAPYRPKFKVMCLPRAATPPHPRFRRWIREFNASQSSVLSCQRGFFDALADKMTRAHWEQEWDAQPYRLAATPPRTIGKMLHQVRPPSS